MPQPKPNPFGNIPILNQPKLTFTITVDLNTGAMMTECAGPVLSPLEQIDLLATAIQNIDRRELLRHGAQAPASHAGGTSDEANGGIKQP